MCKNETLSSDLAIQPLRGWLFGLSIHPCIAYMAIHIQFLRNYNDRGVLGEEIKNILFYRTGRDLSLHWDLCG